MATAGGAPVAARRRYAKIILAIAKGMAAGMGIGLVIGPLAGYLLLSLAFALADEPPNPNGPPGLALAPVIFGLWGAVIGALLFGCIRGMKMWLATDSPADAARHRETLRRAVVFGIPALIGVIAGYFWGSFAHEQAVGSMRANAAAAGRFATDSERRVPGYKALAAFLLLAVPGTYIGLLALRRRRALGSKAASDGGP